MHFVDAFLNASLILGNKEQVDPLHDDAAKYFASFYALYCGITLLTTVAVLLAPMIHRAMHRFHLETDEETDGGTKNKNTE